MSISPIVQPSIYQKKKKSYWKWSFEVFSSGFLIINMLAKYSPVINNI